MKLSHPVILTVLSAIAAMTGSAASLFVPDTIDKAVCIGNGIIWGLLAIAFAIIASLQKNNK